MLDASRPIKRWDERHCCLSSGGISAFVGHDGWLSQLVGADFPCCRHLSQFTGAPWPAYHKHHAPEIRHILKASKQSTAPERPQRTQIDLRNRPNPPQRTEIGGLRYSRCLSASSPWGALPRVAVNRTVCGPIATQSIRGYSVVNIGSIPVQVVMESRNDDGCDGAWYDECRHDGMGSPICQGALS